MKNQSQYDPSRKTVGAIYKDLQENSKGEFITVGDMTNELMSSLVEDLNETIIDGSKEFQGKEFYITVHEKKDLQMKTCMLRRMLKTKYRPYPEDDTMVFHVEPSNNKIEFCWCLPHHTEMDNILANPNLFDKNLVNEIKAWKRVDLYYFGFVKDPMGNWMANPNRKDHSMDHRPRASLVIGA